MATKIASQSGRLRAFAERAPVSTTAIAAIALLALYVFYGLVLAPELFTRSWGGPGGGPGGGSGGWYAEVVRVLLLAYTPVLTVLSRRSALDTLDALEAAIDGGAKELRREVTEGGAQLRVMGAVAGIAFGIWSTFGSIAPHIGVLAEGASRIALVWDVAWALSFYALLGRALLEDLRLARLFARLGAGSLRLDLLQLGALRPFANQSLRTVLRWAIWFAMSSLFLIGRPDVFNALGMLPLLAISVTALLVPASGVRRRIRALKSEALERIDDRLRASRSRLDDGDTAFADWAAYRSLVATAPEWPFDLGSLTRVTLYLAIGAGSWLGAALVERGLDRFLN